MRLPKMLLVLAAALAISCRDVDDDPGTGGGPDASLPSGMTIKAFLQSSPAADSMVTFDNVVVVAHVSTRDDGKLWIQDPGGGAQSGMMLFCDFDSPSQMCPMGRDDVDGLEIGDVISVSGKFVKAFSGRIQQMTMPRWEQKGLKMAPVAVRVDAAAVAKGAEAIARPWEAVYVKVDAHASMSNMMAPEFKNDRCTPPPSDAGAPAAAADAGPAPIYYNRGFEVEADGATLAVGFKLYDTMTYCLADCGYCQEEDMITDGMGFRSIAGVVYFERGGFNPSVDFLEIRPTTNDDLPLD
jgi:hypothetical protein